MIGVKCRGPDIVLSRRILLDRTSKPNLGGDFHSFLTKYRCSVTSSIHLPSDVVAPRTIVTSV